MKFQNVCFFLLQVDEEEITRRSKADIPGPLTFNKDFCSLDFIPRIVDNDNTLQVRESFFGFFKKRITIENILGHKFNASRFRISQNVLCKPVDDGKVCFELIMSILILHTVHACSGTFQIL